MAYFRYANKLKKDKDPESLVLLHFEDDFVEGQITDVKGNVFTRSNANVELVNDSKFGSHSLYLHGGIIQSGVLSKFDDGIDDFTIDFWMKSYNEGRMSPINMYYGGVNMDIEGLWPRMWFINEWGNAWIISGDNNSGSSNIRIPAGEWTHIAYVRNGAYITIYVNGREGRRQEIGANTRHWYDPNNISVRIGSWDMDGYYMFDGYLDEVRITDSAVWTEEFTPPTRPYNN